MNLSKNSKLLAMTMLLLSTGANAQVKPLSIEGGHVGGGDPSELAEFTGLNGVRLESWYSVKQDLIAGISMGKASKLDLGRLNLADFNEKVISALRSTKVEFDHQKIQVDGTHRPCENYHDDTGFKRIHCNIEDYQSAMSNFSPETQYKFVAHEYFGAAGLEPNAYAVSDYPFSAQISDHLSQIQVKRWAVREAPPIEDTAVAKIQKSCPAQINLKLHHMYGLDRNLFSQSLAEKGYLVISELSNFQIDLGGMVQAANNQDTQFASTFIGLKHNGHTVYENNNKITIPSEVPIYLNKGVSDFVKQSTYKAIETLPACEAFKGILYSRLLTPERISKNEH